MMTALVKSQDAATLCKLLAAYIVRLKTEQELVTNQDYLAELVKKISLANNFVGQLPVLIKKIGAEVFFQPSREFTSFEIRYQGIALAIFLDVRRVHVLWRRNLENENLNSGWNDDERWEIEGVVKFGTRTMLNVASVSRDIYVLVNCENGSTAAIVLGSNDNHSLPARFVKIMGGVK